MSAQATAPDAGAAWKPRYNPWLIAVSVTLPAFMEILDTTIVNVALPHIAGSLSSSSAEATWALTSYLVANGIVLTISGWLGDLLGRKRYFIICIVMFTVCSFLCGTSTSLAQLIVYRLAQGFFGGGLQPNQQSIILDSFPPARRAAAFGVTAIATIVAPVLGPTLGGIITDQASWQWIFYLNVPVGVLAVFLVSVLVEDPPWEKNKRSQESEQGLVALRTGADGRKTVPGVWKHHRVSDGSSATRLRLLASERIQFWVISRSAVKNRLTRIEGGSRAQRERVRGSRRSRQSPARQSMIHPKENGRLPTVWE